MSQVQEGERGVRPGDIAEMLKQALQPLVDDGTVTHIYTPPVCICKDEDIRDIACQAHQQHPAPYTFWVDSEDTPT